MIGGILFALNTIAYSFVSNMAGIFVLRVLNGVSQGIYFGAAGTIVADIVPKERLVDGIGYFGIASSLAVAITPVFGLFLFQNYGSSVLFAFASLSAVIGALFPLFVKTKHVRVTQGQAEKPKEKGIPKLSSLIEVSVLVPAVVSFFIIFGNSAVLNFLTSCGIARGIEGVGLFFTFHSASMIVIRIFTGKLSKKFGSVFLLTAGSVLLAAAFAIIAFAQTVLPVILAGILAGAGFGIVSPLLNALVFEIASPERKGVANSTYGLFNDIGNGIGGSFWGGVSQFSGYTVTYLMSAACVAIGGALHLRFLRPKIKENRT